MGPCSIGTGPRRGTGLVVNNTTCTNWPGAQVGFTVKTGGTLLISASFYVRMYHSASVGDYGEFALGNTTTDCTTAGEWAVTPPAAPPDIYDVSVSLTHMFSVPAAGHYTIYLNGLDYGSDVMIVFNGNIEGAFFPS